MVEESCATIEMSAWKEVPDIAIDVHLTALEFVSPEKANKIAMAFAEKFIGCRILAPGEMDRDTLEAAASVARNATVRFETHYGAPVSEKIPHGEEIARTILELGK